MGTRVTIRYARALFELAREKKIISEVEEDLRSIAETLDRSDELVKLLESPIIGHAEKKKVFSRLFGEKLHPLTEKFIDLVFEKNRENLLGIIIERFMELSDEEKGILRGELITAHPFSEKQKASLKTRLDEFTGKNVVFEQRSDESLLGGFVIRMKDTVIDTSLKNQLEKLHEVMTSGQ